MLSSRKELERLHDPDSPDDIYELVNYVSNGSTEVTPKNVSSRALGIKPYSTETEEAFLQNLNHALDNILLNEEDAALSVRLLFHRFSRTISHAPTFSIQDALILLSISVTIIVRSCPFLQLSLTARSILKMKSCVSVTVKRTRYAVITDLSLSVWKTPMQDVITLLRVYLLITSERDEGK